MYSSIDFSPQDNANRTLPSRTTATVHDLVGDAHRRHESFYAVGAR